MAAPPKPKPTSRPDAAVSDAEFKTAVRNLAKVTDEVKAFAELAQAQIDRLELRVADQDQRLARLERMLKAAPPVRMVHETS